MSKKTVYILHFWLIFCAASLSGCGHSSDSSKTLQVQLQIPKGAQEASFWLGVQEKNLLLRSSSGAQLATASWDQRADIDIHAGDILSFEGRDANNRLLVFGDVVVGKENTLLIPVERVL